MLLHISQAKRSVGTVGGVTKAHRDWQVSNAWPLAQVVAL